MGKHFDRSPYSRQYLQERAFAVLLNIRQNLASPRGLLVDTSWSPGGRGRRGRPRRVHFSSSGDRGGRGRGGALSLWRSAQA